MKEQFEKVNQINNDNKFRIVVRKTIFDRDKNFDIPKQQMTEKDCAEDDKDTQNIFQDIFDRRPSLYYLLVVSLVLVSIASVMVIMFVYKNMAVMDMLGDYLEEYSSIMDSISKYF